MANEKRLIDANVLKIAFKCREKADIDMYGGCHIAECFQGYEASEIVDKMPTVDAVEVVHGRWENITGGMITLGDCSECKVRQPVIGTNYCKNCGAKMDKNENP